MAHTQCARASSSTAFDGPGPPAPGRDLPLHGKYHGDSVSGPSVIAFANVRGGVKTTAAVKVSRLDAPLHALLSGTLGYFAALECHLDPGDDSNVRATVAAAAGRKVDHECWIPNVQSCTSDGIGRHCATVHLGLASNRPPAGGHRSLKDCNGRVLTRFKHNRGRLLGHTTVYGVADRLSTDKPGKRSMAEQTARALHRHTRYCEDNNIPQIVMLDANTVQFASDRHSGQLTSADKNPAGHPLIKLVGLGFVDVVKARFGRVDSMMTFFKSRVADGPLMPCSCIDSVWASPLLVAQCGGLGPFTNDVRCAVGVDPSTVGGDHCAILIELPVQWGVAAGNDPPLDAGDLPGTNRCHRTAAQQSEYTAAIDRPEVTRIGTEIRRDLTVATGPHGTAIDFAAMATALTCLEFQWTERVLTAELIHTVHHRHESDTRGVTPAERDHHRDVLLAVVAASTDGTVDVAAVVTDCMAAAEAGHHRLALEIQKAAGRPTTGRHEARGPTDKSHIRKETESTAATLEALVHWWTYDRDSACPVDPQQWGGAQHPGPTRGEPAVGGMDALGRRRCRQPRRDGGAGASHRRADVPPRRIERDRAHGVHGDHLKSGSGR